MRIRFKFKLIIIFIIFSLLISIGTLFFSYRKAVAIQKQDLKSSLIMTATLGAQLLDGDEHNKIRPLRSSLNDPLYQKIKSELMSIYEANPKIRYVYTIRKHPENGGLIFVVDSATIEDLFSYPGDRYESSNDTIIFDAFQNPQVNDDLIRESWGSYMSGFAPIRNAQGEGVAVLGVDMSGDTIDEIFNVLKYNTITICLVSVLASILLGVFIADRLTQPMYQLLEGTKRISEGDLNYKVRIDSKDEMGTLAQSFNVMSDSLTESNKKLRTNFLNAIRALTVALEAKDPYTKGHSERVTEYGLAIARELKVPEKDIENLKYLYIMHDIGKIGIKEDILNKEGELSAFERSIISDHPEIGSEIVEPISGFLNDQLAEVVRSHHERPDGKGYPRGLHKGEIPLYVSILTVADAYDAMVSDRPYRKAHSQAYAISELKNNAGTQFDTDVVNAFIRILTKQADNEQQTGEDSVN